MRFVRLTVSKTTGRVVGVAEIDVPFEASAAGTIAVSGHECETVDLGVVADFGDVDWSRLDGTPCSPSEHIRVRLERVPAARALEEAKRTLRVHDCPCTLAGIRERLRAGGPEAIPSSVRAWLANVLPADRVAAMGIARGLPISAMKAAEALRNRRDPVGGSRMHVLERKAQQQADGLAAARLRARKRETAKSRVKHFLSRGESSPGTS